MTDLLPCPFCGAPARDDLLPHAGGPGWVQCSACECDQHMSDTLEEAVARWNRRSGVPAQGAGDCGVLWCCHVRGPDDVYAAPDYVTALAWSDLLNEMNWRSGAYPKSPRFKNPESYSDCLVKAVPAPWPHSAESHAEDLPKSIQGFALPSTEVK